MGRFAAILLAVTGTVALQVVAQTVVLASVRFIGRRTRGATELRRTFWISLGAVVPLFFGHFAQVGLWAGVLLLLGALQTYNDAFYFSLGPTSLSRAEFNARARGVPSAWYNDHTVSRLVKLIAQGYTLRQIANLKGYPGLTLMLKWYAEKPEFRQKIERAKIELVERFAEDILDIADDAANDYVVKTTGSGKEYKTVDHENVNRSKLRIETRKWLMSKLRPERYGDNMRIDKKVDIVARVEAMTPQQRIARADQLLEMGRQFLPLLEKVEAAAAEAEEDEELSGSPD
jgi:hypothetical protein